KSPSRGKSPSLPSRPSRRTEELNGELRRVSLMMASVHDWITPRSVFTKGLYDESVCCSFAGARLASELAGLGHVDGVRRADNTGCCPEQTKERSGRRRREHGCR